MDDTLKEALRLHKLGFAIHWLMPGEKRPISEGWVDAPRLTESELKSSYRPGLNIGFRPGRWSVVRRKEVCVLDIDIRGGKDFADEAYAAARSIMGKLYTPTVISGSGVGRHQYLGFPIGASPPRAATTLRQSDLWVGSEGRIFRHKVEGARPAWLIELLSTGKNVVLPPSIHPDTGRPYAWAEGDQQ